MKNIITLFWFLVCTQVAFSQAPDIDATMQKVAIEKDDDIRIELMTDFFLNASESDPILALKNDQRLLVQSQKDNDRICEALALTFIGYNYRGLGNTEKSLEYALKGNEIAQEMSNERLIATANVVLGNCYKDLSNYPKAINLFMSGAKSGDKVKYYKAQTWAYQNLSEVYLAMGKIDSALMYAQMDYELCLRIKYFAFISYTLQNLATIHGKMSNAALAISYYDMAIQEGFKTNSPKQLNWTYALKAQYFNDANQIDSSIVYAKKAISVVQNTAFTNYSIKPARLLLDIYRNSNIDSAFKYSEIYRVAKDSLFSAKVIQQTQLLTFENEVREQELASEKIAAETQRKQNIQYALIAISIITFIILFLLLSRSFITNTRVIAFLSVMALLIVFEFLNLLLHPSLAEFTNHTPALMLAAMVCLAALLIPLHHRIEKWTTQKLIEKNRTVRLANAKRTIEELEEETTL